MTTNLYLGAHDEFYLINLDMVMYIQADDHYSHVYYATGITFMVSYGLSKIENLISEQHPRQSKFLRLGRKYIVNTTYVFHVNTIKQIILLTDINSNTHSLHIPKPVLRELIDNIKQFHEINKTFHE